MNYERINQVGFVLIGGIILTIFIFYVFFMGNYWCFRIFPNRCFWNVFIPYIFNVNDSYIFSFISLWVKIYKKSFKIFRKTKGGK